MELHLLDLLSAPLWTLISALVFLTLALIAIFVCLEHAKLSHKLAGFCITVPLYVFISVIACGDTGGLISGILPPLGLYPIIGFLASVCLGILCLNFAAVISGTGALKRKGAVINTISSLISFALCGYLTYSAWKFAEYTYENRLFRLDGGKLDIKDALPYLKDFEFIPNSILDSGIEIAALAVLFIFTIIYFLSFIAIKTPEEMIRDDYERKRRKAISEIKAKRSKRKKDEDCGDEDCYCCAFCENAEHLKTSPMKMLCKHHGVVASSHVCRKYVYDPLKRKTFRPRISPLSQSDFSEDDKI